MNNLAPYYDDLLSDLEATQLYGEFIKSCHLQSPILELACGSGDLSLWCQKSGYHVIASDISAEMLKLAKEKGVFHTYQLDMRKFDISQKFNTILCFGDSLNFLLDKSEMMSCFESVYHHLNDDGLFIFDYHSLNRLDEFSSEYLEEADNGDYQYQWSIMAEDDYLIHDFVFFTEEMMVKDQIVQKIFDEQVLEEMLKTIGFKFEKTYDFYDKESNAETEKVFYCCRR